jgi:hypothetical protein
MKSYSKKKRITRIKLFLNIIILMKIKEDIADSIKKNQE